MKSLLAFLLGCLPALAGAMAPCTWGTTCTVPLKLYEPDGVDLATVATIAVPAGDITVSCNNNTETAGASALAEGGVYSFSLTLSAAQTQCERLSIAIRDQDATAAYLADDFNVETCGNASAAYVNCTSALSTHSATDIVSGGAILTAGGAVSTVTSTASTTALGASAEASVLAQSKQALQDDRLDELMNAPISAQPQAGSLFGDLTEDDPGAPGTQRYTAAALAQAPSGGGGGPVDLNPDQSTVTIGFVNTVNNPTTCGTVQDKDNYNLAASQTGVTIGTCNNLNNLQPSALADMFNTNSGETYASSVAGSVVKEIADNAQTASVTVTEIVEALGGIRTSIATVTDPTNFTLAAGSSVSLSYQDEYTAVIGNQADSDNSACHRQIVGYLGPSRTVTLASACPAGFNIASGDPVSILPNGIGAGLTVNNGQVETDLTVAVDGTLSLGCMLSAINAVQTGAQTVVGGTDYTYRNPGDTENRVIASRTASGRTQALITCPAGL